MQTTRSQKCRLFPQVIPNEYRKDPKRRAELKVYDACAKILPASWTVFYDVPWLSISRNGKSSDGQADFILAHRNFGVILLEVKGGAIRYDGPRLQWISRDGNGVDHDINPFSQVESSKYALLEKLKQLPELKGCWLELYDCVCFPDVLAPSLGVGFDAPRDIIIDAQDLEKIDTKLENIVAFLNKHAGSDPVKNDRVIQALVRTLASTTEFANPFAIQAQNAEQEIIRLTKEQFRVLDGLGRNRRVAVGGAAGSGKTFLAVEKAKRLSTQGFRTLLVCYNTALSTELQRFCHGISDIEVLNFHSLCRREAKRIGTVLPQYGKGMSQEEVDGCYAEALSDGMSSKDAQKFDAIIVDEAQDFAADWWVAIEDCLADGKQSILYAFYDDNQVLYKGRGCIPADLLEYDLCENIRNSQPIFDVLAKYYRSNGGSDLVSRGPAGRPVEVSVYKSTHDLQQQLGKVLQRLVVQEKHSPSDIVVLTPKSLEDRSQLLTLKLSGGMSLVSKPEDVSQLNILASTINSFKGLERKIVVLTELDDEAFHLPAELRTSLLYVAFSRGRTHMIILGQERAVKEFVSGGAK